MFCVSPGVQESVSNLESEPWAVATGSNNSAKLDDPVATALGSDTDSESPVYYQSSYSDDAGRAVFVQSLSYVKFETDEDYLKRRAE